MNISLSNISKQYLAQTLFQFNITDAQECLDLFDKGTLIIPSTNTCIILTTTDNNRLAYGINANDYENSSIEGQMPWIDNYKKSILVDMVHLASIDQDDSLEYDECINKINMLTKITNVLVEPSNTRYRIVDGQLYDSMFNQIVFVAKNAQINSQNTIYSKYAFAMSDCKFDIPYDSDHIYSFNSGIINASAFNNIDCVLDSAFGNCVNLSAVDLKQTNVLKIGNGAFADTQIVELELPMSLSTICSYAFENINIQQLAIPHNVTTIERCAFSDCYSLSTVEFDNNQSLNIDDDAFENCKSLQVLIFKNRASNMIKISPSIFNGCLNLKYIVFENGMSKSMLNGCIFDRQIIDYKIVVPNDNYAALQNSIIDSQQMEDFNKYFMKYSNYIAEFGTASNKQK